MDNTEMHRLLGSVVNSIEKCVVPDLSSDSNKVTLDLCIRVINYVAAELEYGALAKNNYIENISSVVGAHNQLNKALAEKIPALVKGTQSTNPNKVADAINQLEVILQAQEKYYESLDSDISSGSQVVYKGGRITRNLVTPSKEIAAREITAENLTNYFRKSRAFSDIERADDVLLLTGGFSKVTALFSILKKDGLRKRLAMRKDLKVPLMGASVTDEYPLLVKIHNQGFPVPRPYSLEEDQNWFDGAFILSDAVEGTVDAHEWTTDQGRKHAVIADLATWVAKLHSYNISLLDNDYVKEGSISAGNAMKREIARWKRLYEFRADNYYPLLDMSLAWLENNIPQQLFNRPACIVHGDLGFHNLIVGSNNVAAVLDWEFAHLGDPVEDLAYLKPFLDSASSWQLFLDTYKKNGGISFSQDEELFYKIWSFTRNPIGTLDAKWIFNNEMPEEIKLAVSGNIFRPYLELDAAKLIITAMKDHA